MESLSYRLFEQSDLPGLLRLWDEHSGWGSISEQQWRQWFLNTPQGSCLVAVALDEKGEVAGQEVFTPAYLEVAGRKLRALRVSAPILRQDLRRASIRQLSHPVVQLFLTARNAAVASGFDVIYGMPDHAWLPFFRWMTRVGLPRFEEAEFECMNLRLNVDSVSVLNDVAARAELEAQPPASFGEDYEELWCKAKSAFPVTCGVIRDANWLKFRNGGRITVEVRHRGTRELVGYVAFKRQTMLLADILTREPGTLAAVLAAALSHVASLSNGSALIVKAMATPTMMPALTSLGFEAAHYQFAFVCNSLHDGLAPQAVAPDQWYVTPGD